MRKSTQSLPIHGPRRSAASPHRAASGAEVAAVLADHRVVAAFAAQLALRRVHAVAGVFRRLEDAHLLQREAVVVEDAQHRVAVDDELGDVGDGRRAGLLFGKSKGAG